MRGDVLRGVTWHWRGASGHSGKEGPMETTLRMWRPPWWTEDVHGSAWDRVKESVRRDWARTKQDPRIGGHQMSPNLSDTVKRALGKEHLQAMGRTSMALREWSEVEVLCCYGYAARKQFGAQYPQWNEGLEVRLKNEWTAAHALTHRDWDAVLPLVRHGYEYKEGSSP